MIQMSQQTLIDSRILIKTQKSLRYRQHDPRNINVTIYLYDYACKSLIFFYSEDNKTNKSPI